jgi:hypothetical protein
MTVNEFKEMMKRDNNVDSDDDTLDSKLRALNTVFDVEYDSMFGPFIFFSVSHEDNKHCQVKDKAFKIIKDYIKGK